MIWVIIFCSIVMVGLDYKTTQILFHREFTRTAKIYLGFAWTADLIPLFFVFIGLFTTDNDTPMVMVSMWSNFVYMVVAIARQPLNLAIILSHKRVIRAIGAVVSLAAAGVFCYGMSVTRTDYTINNIELESARLPKEFDGYKITHISDLHVGSMIHPKEELMSVRDLCNGLKSDIILFTGDLVDVRQEEITSEIEDILRSFEADDGVWSIMGNHDIGLAIKDTLTHRPEVNAMELIEKEQRCGWQILNDKTTYITRGEDSIAVTGISFKKELHEHRHSTEMPETDIAMAYDGVPSEIFNITLSHIPQHWDRILELQRADLTLAGHVHAMQMKLPIGKRGVSPSIILYKRWSGLYEEQGRWLYINDGIGCSMYPMRVGTPPEITVITLNRKES